MIVPLAPICSKFCIQYIYILKTSDCASADTQYKLTQKMAKKNYFMKITKQWLCQKQI